uniref:HTH_48 domain-containing protein n=1 Tax=Caenorhabditis japonica TaxID=281687 RepID=A0A8R1EED8_CAEJA
MNDLTRPQLRLIIFYEWSCGTSAAETVTKIGKVFGETTVTDRAVRNWCGRPTALNNDLLRDAVKERPDVTTRELETILGCSHQTISNHLHDLGYRRVLAIWVPYALSTCQMQARVTACQSVLLTPQRKEFLADLVTEDESWVLYNNDTHRAVWIPRGDEPPVQPNANLHEKEIVPDEPDETDEPDEPDRPRTKRTNRTNRGRSGRTADGRTNGRTGRTKIGPNGSLIHDLGYRRVLAIWVPYALSTCQMQARVTACQSVLLTPQRKEFLADLVTEDESWVLYNNDTHRAVWIPRGDEPPVQPNANLHEKKCLLSCFWDAKGMLYYELLPQGRTVNATTYSNHLASLALALREKRPRRSAVHLLHDDARPHVTKATQAKLQELNWDTVPHPPYSPDITSSDYHLFRPLKLFLKEMRFAKYEDLKMAVFDFFDSQSAAFWKKGIDDLPERWLTVVTNDGQYIVDWSC